MAIRSTNPELSASVQASLSSFDKKFHQLDLAKKITRFAFRLLKDWHKAEDVASETYWRLYRMITREPNYLRKSLTACTFRIARNICADITRCKNDGLLSLDYPVPHGNRVLFLVDEIEDTSLHIEGVEKAAILYQALLRLPDQYRLPVTLVSVDGLSNREAAAMLEISEPAFKSRLYRGRRQLRQILSAMGIEEWSARQ